VLKGAAAVASPVVYDNERTVSVYVAVSVFATPGEAAVVPVNVTTYVPGRSGVIEIVPATFEEAAVVPAAGMIFT